MKNLEKVVQKQWELAGDKLPGMAPDPIFYFKGWLYIAAFPTALAVIGGHLATLTLEKHKTFWKSIIWGIGIAAILVAGDVQASSYRTDKRNYTEQVAKDLESSTRQEHLSSDLRQTRSDQARTREGMDAIVIAVKQLGPKQLASVVLELAQNTTRPQQPPAEQAKPMSVPSLRSKALGLSQSLKTLIDSSELTLLASDHGHRLSMAKDNQSEIDKENARYGQELTNVMLRRAARLDRMREQISGTINQLLSLPGAKPIEPDIRAILDGRVYSDLDVQRLAYYLQGLAQPLPTK